MTGGEVLGRAGPASAEPLAGVVAPGRGRRHLRRFARVSAVVTAVDVGGFLAARSLVPSPVALADAGAVAVASGVSFSLHRRMTFGDDPYVRWVNRPGVFAGAAALAGAVDVAVVAALAGRRPSTPKVLAAKAVAVSAAGGVRLLAYRSSLLTDVRRTLAARPSRPAPPGSLRLSVVIPAYQEAIRIGATVDAVRAALAEVDGSGGLEVVVVDDGSTDGTAAEAVLAGARVVRLEDNRGKGAAVRAGVLASSGRCVAFTDADLAYPPHQIAALLDAVEAGSDVAVGNRFHRRSTTAGPAAPVRALSGRFFNVLTATVLLGQYRDTQCGFKAFRSDAARQIFSRTRLDGFAFDVEVLHLVERDRLALAEVPVTLVDTPGSTVRLAIDATRMVRDLFRVRRWAGQGRYDR